MPSPFPGMNPYLERQGVWQDFHTRFVTALSDALVEQLLPRYVVSLEEHVYVHAPPEPDRYFSGRPDVAVKRTQFEATQLETDTAVLDAPSHLLLPERADISTEPYLEIRDRDDELVITVIELLSPTNKRAGPDREQYLAKRQRYLASNVHVIEIDLLRGGDRMPAEDLPDCDYYVLVRRAEQLRLAGVWPLRLRDPLPLIPVPLQAPDPDARLNLQSLLHLVYDRAGYRYRIYNTPPRPPLHPEDAKWAEAVVAEHQQGI